jgi:uncharacterized membrane protein
MTPSSYKIVKLINGEDIICTISPLDCDKHIRVEFPLKMQVAPRMQRDRVVESLNLSHWVHPATETTIFDIPSTSVIMMADVSPGLSKYYEYVLKKMDSYEESIEEIIQEEDIDNEEIYNELLLDLDSDSDSIH